MLAEFNELEFRPLRTLFLVARIARTFSISKSGSEHMNTHKSGNEHTCWLFSLDCKRWWNLPVVKIGLNLFPIGADSTL